MPVCRRDREVVTVPVGPKPLAYNSLWQLRNDTWSSLEESTTQLALADAQQRPVGQLAETVTGLLDVLGSIERFWAFPGAQTYQEVQRLFAAGKYNRLAAVVSRANRALVTESYRGGQAWDLRSEDDAYERDSHPAKQFGSDRPYFEVLVVEDLTEEQESSLREELRRWRRPDDQFIYEIVVVPSFDEAVMAARLNFRLQACVVRRRFTHRSRHDSALLAPFAGIDGADDLMEHSPDDRAQVTRQVAGQDQARTRPVPDDGDLRRGSGRPAQPPFPAHLPCPGRLARAAPVHPGRRGGAVSCAVLQRAARLQPPAHRGIPRAADLARQVDRQLPLDQGHGRLLRPGDLPGRDLSDLRRPRLAARADRTAARGAAARGRDVRLAADLLRHQRDLDRQQDRRAGPGPARRHRAGRPELPPVASLRADAGRRHGDLPGGVPAEPVLDVRRRPPHRDQAPAAGAAAGGQAGPGQDAAADQLHVRRDRLRRRAG